MPLKFLMFVMEAVKVVIGLIIEVISLFFFQTPRLQMDMLHIQQPTETAPLILRNETLGWLDLQH